jgi:hypothetical protein
MICRDAKARFGTNRASRRRTSERCSIRKSKRVDQGGKSSRLIATAWIIEKIAGEGWTPVPQDLDQAPFCDHLRYRLFHCRCDTNTVQHCLDNQVWIVERRWSLLRCIIVLAVFSALPASARNVSSVDGNVLLAKCHPALQMAEVSP